jgi:hypothetical protein
MNVTTREAMKELIGEHEAIIAYMQSMTSSARKLAVHPAGIQERLWNYRHRLYDFKDAIWYHLEIDERVFRSILGEASADPIEEHREIQRLVNEMIMLADNTIIERMAQAEVEQYCQKLEAAFNIICRLIELHISKENTILARVQAALNNQPGVANGAV